VDAVSVQHADCLELLPGLEAESVDACVTDPPYGLEFMGKDWDRGVPGVAFWTAVGAQAACQLSSVRSAGRQRSGSGGAHEEGEAQAAADGV